MPNLDQPAGPTATEFQRRRYFRIVSDYIINIKLKRQLKFELAKGAALMRRRT